MTESKKISNHNSTPKSKELKPISDFKIPEFKTKEELKDFIVGLLKQVKPEVYDELIVDVLDEVDSQRNYYDTIFRTIFSKKEDLLELYNAVNDTNYTNVDDLEINTLNNAMFVTMRNDISFIFNFEMNLYEHQSTLSPNMPLRDLFYVTSLYYRWVKKEISGNNGDGKKKSIYSRVRLRIPTPRFVMFYNGKEDAPEQFEYRLSDLYLENTEKCSNKKEAKASKGNQSKTQQDPSLELIVKVYNINTGKNEKIQNHCKKLREYGILISKVRKNISVIEQEEAQKLLGDRMTTKEIRTKALILAREECLKEGILTEFLENEEVIEMWALDRDYDTEIEIIREQELEAAEERGIVIGQERGIAIGEERGEARGVFKTVAELCFEGIISEEIAADKLQVSLEEFHSKFEEYKLNI